MSDAYSAFGRYVGHDEPSVLFYSNVPGSGNQMQYHVTLPTEPAGAFSDLKGYSLETSPAFWFGMAMCDTQSYPETTTHCTPDSDSNIVDPATTKKAPGSAFMELQFYAPGFAPQFAANSCDGTRWCVAMTIDSLSESAPTGRTLNASCTNAIGGSPEYVNFAYLTLNGTPLGPPNPVQFQFINSGDPQPVAGRANNDTFFMNQGDNLTVSLSDTANGLAAVVHDNSNPDPTTNTGMMVASAANGFGQVKYAPTGTGCTNIPYTFHPMYSTSSPKTRVLWAAHSYNVAMDAETGHFDFCSSISADTGQCNGTEGIPGNQEPADGEDFACFSDAQNTNPAYVAPAGQDAAYCMFTNAPGFDGTSYNNYWPNGSSTHSTAFLFSSPHTGTGFSTAYPQAAFETDLPRIEAADLGGTCVRFGTGAGTGCSNPPTTDDGKPVNFYPYFSTVSAGGGCMWGAGSTLPNTTNNFGGSSAEFGQLLGNTYWITGGNGKTRTVINDYNSGAFTNPC